MANYIDKEILAEAYTHLDIDTFHDKERLAKLEKELKAFFSERASFIFETDVEIVIEFEEGSLKTRVIALGSAAAIIGTVICNYPSFKDGIKSLSNDAASIAQAANIEVIFRTKTPYCDRLRIEKRRGVFGRVESLLVELESIREDFESSKMPTTRRAIDEVEKTNSRLIEWDERFEKVLSKLDAGDTQACIADGLRKELLQFPAKLPWQDELSSGSLNSKMVSSDPKVNAGAHGAIARYAAIRKNSLARLKAVIDQNK